MIPSLEYPELVFGLCSPLGTENKIVSSIIEDALKIFNYSTSLIKATSAMQGITLPEAGYQLKNSPYEERYNTYINYANKIRSLFDNPSALAMICAAAISSDRRKNNNKNSSYIEKHAYIVDQFKRKEEIQLFRQIYGRLFILISVYSDKEKRISRISDKIASSHGSGRPSETDLHQARELVSRDESEDKNDHGQRLRETFALGDVFVNIDNQKETEEILKRFLNGIFGSNKISPTRDEYGMFAAKGASLRSLDLSRQVGAAIFSPESEILTMGSNEVPKPHGGTYWTGDEVDERDYARGYDENERIKRSIITDAARRLQDAGYLKDGIDLMEISESISLAGSPLRESLAMDLLEFGRIIHAEMSAICDAARTGRSIKGATLYCTTFPCHICAKHIVASGINRVIYVEPYPKSYATHLQDDAIVVTTNTSENSKVIFAPFIGISPHRYKEIFERSKRKDSKGEFIEWKAKEPRPIINYTVANWLSNEAAVTAILNDIIEELHRNGKIVRPEDQAPDETLGKETVQLLKE